jgi:sacsin
MPVPEIKGVQFVIATSSSFSKQIFQALKLVECLRPVQIIQDHIIPAWKSGEDSHWTPSCKVHLATYILGNFSDLSLEHQAELRTIPMVPVSQLNGGKTLKFALAAQLIDPSIPKLRGLYFDDEEIVPKQSFLTKFKIALIECGLKTEVDETIIDQRIQCYASAKYPLGDKAARAKRLLLCVCHWRVPLNELEGSDLRNLKWLPVLDSSGSLSLRAAYECRNLTDKSLVSSQLPLLQLVVSDEWRMRLGWDQMLPSHILLSQLEFGIQTEDWKIIDAILTYISRASLIEPLVDDLMNLRCVLASNGSLILPSQAFRPQTSSNMGCKRLQPYLANIDKEFWKNHKDLLIRLKVGDQLQLTDLLNLQTILEAQPKLETSDVDIAVEILNLASEFPRTALTGLKVLSEANKFIPIHDINFDDLGILKPKQKVHLTHPHIPRRIIEKLGIDNLSELMVKGVLEIEDVDDDDEFDQREDVTSRISDTLDRYPVETTFREYLANADDTIEASKISWLLDERTHRCDMLLTPKMATFQGPALLVHNDGGKSSSTFDFGDTYYIHLKYLVTKTSTGSKR